MSDATQADYVDALVRQTIVGQSILYRLLTKELAVKDSKVSRIEITYFALTVALIALFRFGRALSPTFAQYLVDHAEVVRELEAAKPEKSRGFFAWFFGR